MFTKSISLGHDVTLEYAEYGDPKGVPVILLHGVTDSYRSFDPIVPYLPGTFCAIAISQRGHGHSSRPLTGYRYADFADDLDRFMTALRLPSAIIVGHSMGGLVAQRFAIDHPSRTLGLVLEATFPTICGHGGVQAFWDTTLAQLTDPVDEELVREFQQSTITLPIAPSFFATVVEESLKVPAHVWRATFREFLATDFSHELTRVQTPTLLLFGDRDLYCGPAEIDGLRRGLPHAQTIVYPSVGHAVHWEIPERFARDLVSFVQEHCLHHAI
jgi:non-heme chloroperoxidase